MAIPPTGKILALGNPIDSASHFAHECEVAEATGKWKRLTISGENHPNFLQRKVVVAGAITYERIKELEKEYGRDHPLFKARVLGEWSKELGRMYPQFSDKRHTFDPETLRLDAWLSWFAACDIGYAHPAAVLWGRFDGTTTYIVREFVKAGLDARELARVIIEKTNPGNPEKSKRVKLDSFCLSFDGFNRVDGPRSRADEMGDELRKANFPWPTPATRDRIAGANLIRTMLNANSLKISTDCPKLIAGLKRSVVNPDKPEDSLKESGDDEVDSLRYLLTMNPRLAPTPLEITVEEKTRPLKDKGDFLTAMLVRSRLEAAAKTDQRVMSLGRFMRRGVRPSN
jgi:hypothetical protein